MRVGNRILRLLEIAEENGGCVSNSVLRREWPDVVDSNRCKYLARAVAMDLIHVIDKNAYPKQYRVVPDWKERVFGEKPRKYVWSGFFSAEAIEARKKAKKPPLMVNSVFSLGALYE